MAWVTLPWNSEWQESELRIDRVLARHLPDYSRTFIQDLLPDNDLVRVNSNIIHQARHKLGANDVLELDWDVLENKERQHIPQHLEPWHNPELDQHILFEDEDLLVLNKPVGVMVHPGAGEWRKTLVNWLLYRYGKEWNEALENHARPGIVHRLDKDTSGAIVIAKNTHSLQRLQEQIKTRQLGRVYYALTYGDWEQHYGVAGSIDCYLQRDPVLRTRFKVVSETTEARHSLSEYKVVAVDPNRRLSLLKFKLATGRTHQIRIHAEWMGCPIVADPVYHDLQRGKKRVVSVLPMDIRKLAGEHFKGQALHAWKLSLIHPKSQQKMNFYAPLPPNYDEFFKSVNWQPSLGT